MEQHPIPRQITSFEFKLVGFLTIKQFIYLVVFVALGAIVYGLFPIPILNVLLGLLVVGAGAAFAFLPINDRPLDVWVKNLIKRLTSPTQYLFKKNNAPPAFLLNLSSGNTTQTATHIESQQKLSNYLSKNTPASSSKKQDIHNLMQNPIATPAGKSSAQTKPITQNKPVTTTPPPSSHPKKPFLTGIIKNRKNTPLYGIMIYIKKDPTQNAVRILKTNVNGVFATFNPLPSGEYFFEIKDPQDIHLFDTMKIKVEETNVKPMEFISKELL